MLRIHMLGAEWFDSRPGGLNRYFEELWHALASRDDVDVSAAAFGPAPAGGVSMGPVGISTISRLRAARNPFHNANSFDVLDTHFAMYSTAFSLGKHFSGTHVVHFQGPWAGESRIAGAGPTAVRIKKAWERSGYRKASRVIVLSKAFRDIAIKDYGVDGERILVIPPAVNLVKFVPNVSLRNSDNGFRAICVRRLERRMGIHVLVAAWPKVVKETPGAHLDVYGEGGERDRLMRQAEDLGLTRTVTFHGRVSDQSLVEGYQRSDCAVVPSIALEGFGLIALEALACGTPPIVTNCGGLPDAVEGIDPSLVIQPGDIDGLASRLLEAVKGWLPSRRECRFHAEKFDWSNVARQHVEIYKESLR